MPRQGKHGTASSSPEAEQLDDPLEAASSD